MSGQTRDPHADGDPTASDPLNTVNSELKIISCEQNKVRWMFNCDLGRNKSNDDYQIGFETPTSSSMSRRRIHFLMSRCPTELILLTLGTDIDMILMPQSTVNHRSVDKSTNILTVPKWPAGRGCQ
jgi:hypothetical protein